jgi:hypothetical protein
MRYRVEIYDDVKSRDLTIWSDKNLDTELLKELVFQNIRKFSGPLRAYVYDTRENKKTAAMLLDEQIVKMYTSQMNQPLSTI